MSDSSSEDEQPQVMEGVASGVAQPLPVKKAIKPRRVSEPPITFAEVVYDFLVLNASGFGMDNPNHLEVQGFKKWVLHNMHTLWPGQKFTADDIPFVYAQTHRESKQAHDLRNFLCRTCFSVQTVETRMRLMYEDRRGCNPLMAIGLTGWSKHRGRDFRCLVSIVGEDLSRLGSVPVSKLSKLSIVDLGADPSVSVTLVVENLIPSCCDPPIYQEDRVVKWGGKAIRVAKRSVGGRWMDVEEEHDSDFEKEPADPADGHHSGVASDSDQSEAAEGVSGSRGSVSGVQKKSSKKRRRLDAGQHAPPGAGEIGAGTPVPSGAGQHGSGKDGAGKRRKVVEDDQHGSGKVEPRRDGEGSKDGSGKVEPRRDGGGSKDGSGKVEPRRDGEGSKDGEGGAGPVDARAAMLLASVPNISKDAAAEPIVNFAHACVDYLRSLPGYWNEFCEKAMLKDVRTEVAMEKRKKKLADKDLSGVPESDFACMSLTDRVSVFLQWIHSEMEKSLKRGVVFAGDAFEVGKDSSDTVVMPKAFQSRFRSCEIGKECQRKQFHKLCRTINSKLLLWLIMERMASPANAWSAQFKKCPDTFLPRLVAALMEKREYLRQYLRFGDIFTGAGGNFDCVSRTFKPWDEVPEYAATASKDLMDSFKAALKEKEQGGFPRSCALYEAMCVVDQHADFPSFITEYNRLPQVIAWHTRDLDADPGPVLAGCPHAIAMEKQRRFREGIPAYLISKDEEALESRPKNGKVLDTIVIDGGPASV